MATSHEQSGRYRGASPQFETITPPARQRLCLSPIRNYCLLYLRKGKAPFLTGSKPGVSWRKIYDLEDLGAAIIPFIGG